MKNRATLSGVRVGDGFPTRLAGVINLSPESFFKGSIERRGRSLAKRAREMSEAGADIIDVGAMSTAPYLKTAIGQKEEAKRLAWAIPIIRDHSPLPISVDTSRILPAETALKAGAKILNDVTGLAADPRLKEVIQEFDGWILMANPVHLSRPKKEPIQSIQSILSRILAKTKEYGLPNNKIVLDPGVGFFRYDGIPWWRWDVNIIRNFSLLKKLGRPLMVGLSRKSFIGHFLNGLPAEKRLAGSLGATIVAVQNGASIVRTHDVRETKEAILLAELLMREKKN